MSAPSPAQRRLLKSLNRWGGDVAPDAEEDVGCQGAAFWNVVAACLRKGLIVTGEHGTYPLTDAGRAAIASPTQPPGVSL